VTIHRTATNLNPDTRPISLAIGIFDGVHLGHQQIIRQTIADAQQNEALSVVITFDQHPSVIVAPDRVPPLIQPLDARLRTIESLGAGALLLIHFDRGFSQQSGEAFIRKLAAELGGLRSVCVGADFVFGYKRTGNVELLRKLGTELQFTVHGMAAVSLDGQPVSSTRIREAVRAGDFDAAGQMLGRPYALCGRVVRVDQLGRQLGFPTANLDVTGLVLPPNGVYAVHATAGSQTHRGVMNLGLRPTLQSPSPTLLAEVHLLDFSGDLYGAELTVTFAGRLRDEQRFPSLSDLKAQIARDIAAARRLFAGTAN
jgi:riboflavin kinase/FMN adenylyltransferase